MPELGQDAAKRLYATAAEYKRREGEALRLFRPMETQLPFLMSDASERIIRGGVRGGKTILASAEVASAATGIPLTGPDGKELPYRYPREIPGEKRKALRIWIIGYNQKHIAHIYKYLFTPGIFEKFRILEDPVTGETRSWRPWDPEDAKLEKITRPHPPMIPPRFCNVNRPPGDDRDGMAFENKGEHVFSLARLSNGTEIFAFSSGGRPGMGVAVDIVWIDEDVEYPQYVQEWQSRLSDVKGRLIWSAFPWADNDALALMSKRADEESKLDQPDIAEIVLKFSKNPYMPKDEVRKRLKGWRAQGDNTVRARDGGEFLAGLSLVFPSFDIELHGIPCMEREDDPLDKVLSRNNFRIPNHWTHYLGVDPGFAHMGIVMVAIPPPDIGDYYIVYDEVYLEGSTPKDAVRELKKRMVGQQFHSFIMDWHMGRATQVSGKTPRLQWAEEFEEAGIRSRLTHSSFMWGSDNIAARNLMVRRALEVRADGTTKFRCFRETTRYMQREFTRYKATVTKDEITERVRDSFNHLMDANGYCIASEPYYYTPPASERTKCRAALMMEQLEGRKPKDSDTIYMGAGAAPMPTNSH